MKYRIQETVYAEFKIRYTEHIQHTHLNTQYEIQIKEARARTQNLAQKSPKCRIQNLKTEQTSK